MRKSGLRSVLFVLAAVSGIGLTACEKKAAPPPAETVEVKKDPALDAAAAAPDAAAAAPDAAAAPAPDAAAAPAPDAAAAPAPDAAAAPAPDAAAPVADVAAAPAPDAGPVAVANPTGTFKIQVLSATTKNKTVAGAVVTFQKEGMSSVQGVTDDSGNAKVPHAFPADDASVKLIVKKDGFSPLVVSCPCDGLSYAISETIQQLEAFRVVLNWGISPADLDLHVAYPNNHIFFSAKKGSDADLDVDDTDGLGPETITIQKRHDGEKYVFAIHDYSSAGAHGQRKLSNSSAKVFVYVGQTLIRSYYVMPNQVGELWVLFSVDGNGAVQDINNVVDISEADAIGPYLNQLIQRTDMGFPQRTSKALVQRATELLKKGQDLLAANNFEGALDAVQQAVEANPNFSAAYMTLATTFEKLSRAAEAAWAKRKATELAALPAAVGFRVPNERNTLTASSVLANWKHYDFKGANLIDDNLWTSWQPERKAAGGVGEWVNMQFSTSQTLTGFEFSNGFRRLDELGDLYVMNNRIENAVIQFSDGTEFPVHFADTAGETTVMLPAPKQTTFVKLVVKSVYKGTKWNDLAVSEFHALAQDE